MLGKQKILEVSEDLFLKYGVKSVSMDDIAQKIGISKKTLYRFIPNKKNLISSIVGLFIKHEEKTITEIVEKDLNAVEEFLSIAKYVLSLLRKFKPSVMYDLKKYHPETWEMVESLHFDFIHNTIKDNIIKGMASGLYREDIDPIIVAKLYVGKNIVVTDNKMFPMSDFNMEELYKQYFFYHIYGIASKDGLKLLENYKAELF